MPESAGNNSIALIFLPSPRGSRLTSSFQIPHCECGGIFKSVYYCNDFETDLDLKKLQLNHINYSFFWQETAAIEESYIFFMSADDVIVADRALMNEWQGRFNSQRAEWGAFEFYDQNGACTIARELAAYPNGMPKNIFINRELDKNFDAVISGLCLPASLIRRALPALKLLSEPDAMPVFLCALDGVKHISQSREPVVKAYFESCIYTPEDLILFCYYNWLFAEEYFLGRRLLRRLADTLKDNFSFSLLIHLCRIFFKLNLAFRPGAFISFPLSFTGLMIGFVRRRIFRAGGGR